LRLEHPSHCDRVRTALAEGWLFVTNLLAASPQEESRPGGRSIDRVAARVAPHQFFWFFFRLGQAERRGANIVVTTDGGHGVKYIESRRSIERRDVPA
jgi:hypothetical protein